MLRWLQGMQVAALAAVIVLCVAATVVLLDARRALQKATERVTPLIAKTAEEMDEVHRLTLEAGLTAMEARKASLEERAALPKLTAQTSRSLTQLDAWLRSARETTEGLGTSQQQVAHASVAAIETVTAQAEEVAQVLTQARISLVELQAVEVDLDKLVSDPAIASTLAHMDATSAAAESSAKDLQGEVHAITHPGWMKRMWNGALDLAHVFNPL
jgi:transposase-like protein